MTYEVPEVENTYDGDVVFVMARAAVNTLALAYLARRVLPRVREAAPDVRVRVLGSGSDQATGVPGLESAGFVPDLAPEYARARFAVLTTVGWTGQQVRIVEAMAHGLPVVALERSARSSPMIHGENGLVARDADEFADHVVRLWRDPALCRRLGQAAREAVAGGFTQDRLARNLAGAGTRPRSFVGVTAHPE